MLSKKLLIFLAVVLFFIAQVTRFENEFSATYDNKNLTFIMDGVEAIVSAPYYNFSKISATVQQSMAMKGGISRVHILDAENNTIYEFNPPIIYLFGRDLLGNFNTAPSAAFDNTFGDWFLDQFDSSGISLYEKPLPQTFILHVTFVGRGRKSLSLHGSKSVWMSLADG